MLDILSIGSATVDVFIKTPFFHKMKGVGKPKGVLSIGSKIEIESPSICIGGGAHNSSVTFAKQELKSGLLAKIGYDIFGRKISESLQNNHIESHLIFDHSESTGTSFILLDSNGERTVFVSRGVSGNFSKKDVINVPKSRWVYINPGSMPLSVLSELINVLFKRGTHIAINPSLGILDNGFTKIKKILNKSNVVILNREEASRLTGVSYQKKREIFRKLDNEVSGIAIMTDGVRGSSLSDGKNIIESKSFKVKNVVDMTGAGDAFGSAFVSALIEKNELCRKSNCNKENLFYALRKGSANAASVVEHIGATDGIISLNQFKSSPRWKVNPK